MLRIQFLSYQNSILKCFCFAEDCICMAWIVKLDPVMWSSYKQSHATQFRFRMTWIWHFQKVWEKNQNDLNWTQNCQLAKSIQNYPYFWIQNKIRLIDQYVHLKTMTWKSTELIASKYWAIKRCNPATDSSDLHIKMINKQNQKDKQIPDASFFTGK